MAVREERYKNWWRTKRVRLCRSKPDEKYTFGPVQEVLVPDPDPFEEKHFHFYGSFLWQERDSVVFWKCERENSDGEARRESERVVVDSGGCGGLRLREKRWVWDPLLSFLLHCLSSLQRHREFPLQPSSLSFLTTHFCNFLKFSLFSMWFDCFDPEVQIRLKLWPLDLNFASNSRFMHD